MAGIYVRRKHERKQNEHTTKDIRRSPPEKTPPLPQDGMVVRADTGACTVAAAYKVSDGVQQGIKRAAEKSPGHFIGLLSGLTLLFQFVLWCISLAGCAWIALKMYRKYHTRNRKEEPADSEIP